MMLLFFLSAALADPWSQGAATQLADALGDLDGAVVEVTVTGDAPGWLEPATFTRILAEQTGAASIRPARSGPPWPEVALSLALSDAGGDLAVDWKLEHIGEGAVVLGEGEATLRGPSPPDPLADFTGRADWPQIADLLSARHAAGQLTIDGITTGSRSAKDRALMADLKARVEAVREVEVRWQALLEGADTDLRILGHVELGMLYDDMASAFLTSTVPDYLTEDQVEIYRMALEDKAYPQEEKSAGAYRAALEMAWQTRRYLPCIQVAIDRGLDRGELTPLTDVLPLWVKVGDERDDAEALAAYGHWPATMRHATDLPHNRGIIALSVHDTAGALAAFREALIVTPSEAESTLGLAVALRHAGETAAALAILESMPQTQVVLLSQGILHEDAGDYRASSRLLEALGHRASQDGVLELRVDDAIRRQNALTASLQSPPPPPPPPSPTIQLTSLRDKLTELEAIAARCPLSEEEMYWMVREQMVMVLEAEDAEMASDMILFVDDLFLNVTDCPPQ